MTADRKVIENSFLYTFSSLLVKAINFLLLPIYTLFLTPEDYGVINLANGFTDVVIFIIAFSLYSAIVRFYADYKDDAEKLRRFYGTVIVFVFISGIIFAGMGLLFNSILISWFFEGVSFYPVVLTTLLTLAFLSLHNIHQNILQGMQRGKKLTVINLAVFGLQVGLNLLFIGFLKFGAFGVLLSSLIINVGYTIFMMLDLRKSRLITLCIDIEILREALKYSIPIIPHNLSTNIASFAARVFINQSGSLAYVGLYSVATQFAMLIDTIQASVNQAFAPWFFEMMNKKDETGKKDIVELSHFLLIIYSMVYMVIGLFSQEVIIMMTNRTYYLAWTVIPILVMAFSVKSIYYFYINILFYYKDAARKIFIATIIGSFADIMIAFALVPVFGMYGAAVAFLVAKIAVVSIVVVMSRKYHDIGYSITAMLKVIMPSLLFMGVGLYFSYTKYLTEFSFMNLLYKFFILFIYLVFVYMTNRDMMNRILNSGKIKQVLAKIKR
jgi:O-antigen/teichoic acid export membrane protein